jgi:YVTN family beta-propeller protein
VWVTTPTGVTRIDPATYGGTSIALAGPLGDPAVVGGKLWAPQIRANTVAVIDPATNKVSSTIKVGTGPFVVTEIAGDAWIPSWKGTDIWRIRP